MSEEYQIETRRRSRSKTPFLRSSCDHENCDHADHDHPKKKKPSQAPNVHTIVEEHVSESSSLRTRSSKSNAQAAKMQQQVTSDYSSEDSTPDAKRRNLLQSQKTTSSTSKVTTIITQTSRRLGNTLGGLVTSTPRSPGNKSQLNASLEQQQKNSSNGNVSGDHLAYLEYKEAGEYWNKTPKTDYTYSELSPHRRVLAPGHVAMPNMSRRSLENHDERVDFMVQQNPTQEEFIRRRYQYQQYASSRGNPLNYDSADEVDVTKYGLHQQQQQSWWLLRLITTVVSSISSVWSRIANVGSSESADSYHNYYARQQHHEQTGLLAWLKHRVTSVFRAVYLFIASVLSLDTVLLKGHGNPENKAKKRFLLLLLILLPLLLLTGLFYYLHPNESFPPKSFSEYTLTLPELPKFDVNLGQYLNQAQYEAVKSQAVEQVTLVRDWADNYLLYLKTIGRNVANKASGWFQPQEPYYERV